MNVSTKIAIVGFLLQVFGQVTGHSAVAQIPDAPIVLDAGPGGCVPTPEICGDGIDQDCNGSDKACPPPPGTPSPGPGVTDADQDGYSANVDCNDNDRSVYPGRAVACQTSCGQGTQICQSNATYTTCSCTPICEATSGSNCYYVSKLTGSDSNPGSFSQPLKTYLPLVPYYNGTPAPGHTIDVKPGDVVYFMSGTYDDTYSYDGSRRALHISGKKGTASAPVVYKAYPGTRPVINPGQNASGIYVFNSEYVVVDGFEVTGAYGEGVLVNDSNHITIQSNWIHDNDGRDNQNVAGVKFGSVYDSVVQRNTINDNYDHVNDDTGGQKTENSRDMVFFGGGNNRVIYNTIFQSPATSAAKTGGCITYKHAGDPDKGFEVAYNKLWNCSMDSISSGTANTHIHHNLIIDSSYMRIKNHGGDTYTQNTVIEKNTIVRGRAVYYQPDPDYGPIGMFTFRDNIIVDDNTNNIYDASIRIDVYGPDSRYNTVVGGGLLSFSGNCYYNTADSVQINLYSVNGGAYGNQGQTYSLSAWKNAGYDAGAVETNPQLDSNNYPQNSTCQHMGYSPVP